MTQLLVAALLLLLRSDTLGHTDFPAHSQHRSHPAIAAANHEGLLQPTALRYDGDAAQPLLLESEASLPDCRGQSAPPSVRDALPLRSCERTTAEAARPPPFQA